MECEVYTVEVANKFAAVVRVDAAARESEEYCVQPKSEEMLFCSIQNTLTVLVVSALVTSMLFFVLKRLALLACFA